MGATRMAKRLAELRRAFDASFAEPIRPRGDEQQNALAVRAGDRHLAVRIEELAGVEAYRRVVPLPGGAPGLLGLAGVRGQLVAVYDLAAALGCREPAASGPAAGFRWMLLCRQSPDVGLAVEQIEGYLRFCEAEVRPDDGGALSEHAKEALLAGGALRSVLHVSSLVDAIARRARGGAESPKADR